MVDMLTSALGCNALGLSVIPVKREDKRPFIKWEQHQTKAATPEQIRQWWKQWPDANVAVVTGFLSGVFVLDVDGDVGAETLVTLQKQHAPLPRTWRSRTGRGEHIWFRFPANVPDEEFSNSASRLGPGLDTRGQGGYVVAPGSLHASGNRYEWQDDCTPDLTELAPLPDWLLDLVRKPKPAERPKTNDAHAPADLNEYGRCRRILEEERTDLFKAGHGQRNDQLNKAAYVLAQFAHYGAYNESEVHGALLGACQSNGYIAEDGLASFEASFQSGWKAGLAEPRELKEWEPRLQREPLRQRDRIHEQRHDARPSPPHAEPQGEPAQAGAIPSDWARRVDLEGLYTVPPRRWLYGRKLIRGFTTLLVSPGGIGKTALTFAIAASCAVGRSLLHDEPHAPLNVWLYNLEDPYDELRRRLAAVLKHYGQELDAAAIEQRLFMNSGKERGLLIAVRENDDTVTVCEDAQALIAELIRMKIDVLVIDPFIMTHQVNENSNTEIERVLREFNRIATEANCAILLVHHSRKGFVAGDADSIRGGGSLVGAARAAFTLAPMQPDEAEKLNVSADDRRFLVRLDDAKMNLAPKSDKAEWIRLTSVNLGNGDDEYPKGDNVQVAGRWDPPEEFAGLTIELANVILDEMAKGRDGDRYSVQRNAPLPAWRLVANVMAERGIEKSDGWCRQLVGSWLKNGQVREQEYLNANRNKRKGLFVNEANRPGKKHL